MIIEMPNLTLDEALKFEEKLYSLTVDSEVIFDFSKMSNFDPLPMLMVGSIIRRFREKNPSIPFSVCGIETKGKEYAGIMGFFKYISESIDFGKMPGEAKGSSNYIPITPLVSDELTKVSYAQGEFLELGELIERESKRLAQILDRDNKELHKLLAYLIREILRNIPEHAQTNTMWICGQYWPSREFAEIAILDEGIGIFESLRRNEVHREYITDNPTALQWALKAGISESFRPSIKQKGKGVWENSGFGLYMVSEICKMLNGSFCLISYDNYLQMDRHKVELDKTSFQGTAIRMRISSKGISNAQKLILDTSMKGQSEASTIRNAFTVASIPSKGLMDELNIKK